MRPREVTARDHGGHGAAVRGVGNATYLVLVWFSESDDEVREVLAELWAGWCEARRSGERVRARRSNRRQRRSAAAAKEKEGSEEMN